jgi:3-oxoacyl-[acyl-carrier-protein] synthase II
MKRVVVTGIGTINALGNNSEEYWQALFAGRSGAAPITRFDAAKFKTRFACEVKNYDPTNHFEKTEARKYDLFSQYALISAAEAVDSSGLLSGKVDLERVGVIWASGNGGIGTLEEQITEYIGGGSTPRFSPFLVPKMIANMASGLISMKFGFKGITYTAVSACAASNNAIMDALNYIRWGKADVIVTGGSEAAVTQAAIGGFNSMKALSTRNDDPAGASRPFDKDRDGFVLGEGGAALVLESYEHAMARNAPILAEVVGASMTADAYHMYATPADGDGAYRAMKLALEDAGLTIDDIDYINAHATSTGIGDMSEVNAISQILSGSERKMLVNATKSMTGHLLGATGAVEALSCIQSMLYSTIPPTINLHDKDNEIPNCIEIVANKPMHKEINLCMSNTFGFGGHNSIVIFKKYSQGALDAQ